MQNCKIRAIGKTDRSQITPVKYTHVQTMHDFFVQIKKQENFSPDKLSFFWLIQVNKFPLRLEPVNTQADLSLNLAALFCMFWQMWTMRIHYALICTFLVPELCFLFAAVRKEFVCTAPANGDTGRNSSWLMPVVYLHLWGFCDTEPSQEAEEILQKVVHVRAWTSPV